MFLSRVILVCSLDGYLVENVYTTLNHISVMRKLMQRLLDIENIVVPFVMSKVIAQWGDRP